LTEEHNEQEESRAVSRKSQARNPRPGWVALFTKAYSLVAAEMLRIA